MLARMETRDIRRRTDLYCVHILDTARTGTAIADATKQAGTVLSPDAFPPGGTKQIVEELAIEVDTRASDLLYLPEWLVSWSQGTDAQHQSYALETYAGVIAEFWSTATGLASNNFRSPACRGIAWSLATLEAIDLVVLREQQADLLKSIVELLRLHFARPTDSLTDPPQPTEAAPSVWQIIQRTAPSLFPHVPN